MSQNDPVLSHSALVNGTSGGENLLAVKRGRGRPPLKKIAPNRHQTGITLDGFTPPVTAPTAEELEQQAEAKEAETSAEFVAAALKELDDAIEKDGAAMQEDAVHSAKESGVDLTGLDGSSSGNDVLSLAVASTIADPPSASTPTSDPAAATAVAATSSNAAAVTAAPASGASTSSSSSISDNISVATNKIVASLTSQTGNDLTQSEEVTSAIKR